MAKVGFSYDDDTQLIIDQFIDNSKDIPPTKVTDTPAKNALLENLPSLSISKELRLQGLRVRFISNPCIFLNNWY